MELQKGTILIDDIDIATVPLPILRSRLTTIPQDPFILPGTVRLNADLKGTYSDDAIRAALIKVGLWPTLAERGGLDAEMVSASSSLLSQGQRQLFCLARAMLQKGKLVLLDEATSNVDGETDATVQRVLRQEFRECTVLTVAHRLETIQDADRIVLLDSGRLVRFGRPNEIFKTERIDDVVP